MKHTQHRCSNCPINFTLESFGDPWSLLIIRDIVYFGKNTYGEFVASEERMTITILASRLARQEQTGILVKQPAPSDTRKEVYLLTEKGLDLILILVEMANWSAQYDTHTAASAAWIALMKAEKERMLRLIRQTVLSFFPMRYTSVLFQYISHFPWFPLWCQAPLLQDRETIPLCREAIVR